MVKKYDACTGSLLLVRFNPFFPAFLVLVAHFRGVLPEADKGIGSFLFFSITKLFLFFCIKWLPSGRKDN